jgi:(E)-4-hydroxy-3-methylbut-2-enyl-diphosphate synthase
MLQSLSVPQRLLTREVRIGNLLLGGNHPIRIQTMTTTDTMDTAATVAQSIRCIEAGAELVRITAPSKKEAENLQLIKDELRRQGYTTPLVADIHFTPNAAEIAARIVEKVRVNPGNYVDKKKFDFIDYTDADYADEIERIRDRFTPLVRICREHGTAMRIGTNHGSLSDRIMSRYGDTAIGMVESAMEFLRIARDEDYHQVILSMKSSNPLVMVEAYRLLVRHMQDEFDSCYPLHLGVTEAGDGEDGRIKSAIGIGTLLEEGIGDTIRVSLTEDPEFELPVCRDIVAKCAIKETQTATSNAAFMVNGPIVVPAAKSIGNIGGGQVPVVITDITGLDDVTPSSLRSVGYNYDVATDKWTVADTAADYLLTGDKALNFAIPGTLGVVMNDEAWRLSAKELERHYPVYGAAAFLAAGERHPKLNFVVVDADTAIETLQALAANDTVVLCVKTSAAQTLPQMRSFFKSLEIPGIHRPVIIIAHSIGQTPDEHLINFATDTGALMLDGCGQGLSLRFAPTASLESVQATGRTYLPVTDRYGFANNTAFSILQATRKRISKTEYISCPSCGRTLFDLQETTAKIRNATHHLKGVKIAIMGCIVNGPGEMADADFGYVGSGPGKITLYKSKDVMKRNVPSEVAVDELISLLKEHGAWVDREN